MSPSENTYLFQMHPRGFKTTLNTYLTRYLPNLRWVLTFQVLQVLPQALDVHDVTCFRATRKCDNAN